MIWLDLVSSKSVGHLKSMSLTNIKVMKNVYKNNQVWNVFKSVKANNQLPGTRWLQRAPCRRRLLNQSYSGGNDASCISLSSYVIFIILLSFWVFPQDVLNQSYSGGNDASFISLKISSRYSARLTSSSNIKIRGAPLNINVTSKLDLGKGANFSVSPPFPEQGLRAVYRLAGAQQHCSVVFKDQNIRQCTGLKPAFYFGLRIPHCR